MKKTTWKNLWTAQQILNKSHDGEIFPKWHLAALNMVGSKIFKPTPSKSKPCNCEGSQFMNKNHKHIPTSNLNIVKNTKLRKHLTKGPKYLQNKTIY